MTLEKAQRIMGPEVKIRFWRNGPRLLAVATNTDTLKTEGSAITSTGKRLVALEGLVATVYHLRCRQIFKKQKWKCGYCAKRLPLQGHHLKKRSQGRDDRTINIIGICLACHEKAHGR